VGGAGEGGGAMIKKRQSRKGDVGR
jgi:hypothetical protein